MWLVSICALIISSGLRMLKSSSCPGAIWWRCRRSALIWSMAGLTACGDTAEATMSSSQVWLRPRIFFCAVLQGRRTASSWSWPVAD